MSDMHRITMTVNGTDRIVDVPANRALLDALRDECGLPGPRSAARSASAAPAPSPWTVAQ